MFQVGDIVVYRKDVCKVKEIKENHLSGKDYYILVPIDDDSLIIDVPTENRMGWLRKVISKEEAQSLITKIPTIEPIQTEEKNYEHEYKRLLQEDSLENLVKIIKTTYLRNDFRVQNKKKISDKDDTYLKKAERQLYNELSVSLDMTYDETKNYVIQCVEEQLAK